MKAFLITVDDAPGIAARLFEATAARGVNVMPAYALSDGRTGLCALGSEDEAGLRAAIADAGFDPSAVEMEVVELEDRTGTGAELFRKLADAGVDLRIAVPIGMSAGRVQLGLGASDPAALRAALGR